MASGVAIKSWKGGFVSFSEAASQSLHRTSHSNRKKELLDDKEPKETSMRQPFVFRDPIQCPRYLLGQTFFTKDIVYAPVRQWNCEEPPQRVYLKMHMADWWWETQVGLDAMFHGTFLLYIYILEYKTESQ